MCNNLNELNSCRPIFLGCSEIAGQTNKQTWYFRVYVGFSPLNKFVRRPLTSLHWRTRFPNISKLQSQISSCKVASSLNSHLRAFLTVQSLLKYANASCEQTFEDYNSMLHST